MKRLIASIVGLFAILGFLRLTSLDDHLFYRLHALHREKRDTTSRICLEDYHLSASRTLLCLEENLSGITYCRISKTLYVITNDPPMVHNTDRYGTCLREIPLIGFHDTEGIVWLGDNRFAIIEERNYTLNIVVIDESTSSLERSEVTDSFQLDMQTRKNKGLEGIAFDAVNRSLYLVNEKRPRQLIKVDGMFHQDGRLSISYMPDLVPFKWILKDLSGLHFDDHSRHLLFVSDESKRVSEVSLDGRVISYLDLGRGFAGLKADVAQAEGITMDDAGNIYVVSEPNLFYRFSVKEKRYSRAPRETIDAALDVQRSPLES